MFKVTHTAKDGVLRTLKLCATMVEACDEAAMSAARYGFDIDVRKEDGEIIHTYLAPTATEGEQ